MRQYAFIGLGTLAMSMLERVAEVTDQIIVIDKDPALIDRVKDLVKTAFVANVLDEEAFEKVLSDPVDVAVVDLAPDIEASLLVTHRLKKLGVEEIIVKADSDEKAELLRLLGATKIVNSDREASARIVPLMLSTTLYNFLPIGGELVMAEAEVPHSLIGKTLVEADLRQKQGVNVVAIRSEKSSSYRNFDREYQLAKDDCLLLVGLEKEVFAFSGVPIASASTNRKPPTLKTILKTVFKPRD
ncbi:MAG: TrkA family potassium uptake protein [Spirochaetes bacterium]|nr:TrkA family potassium uptake protein [Spirochaetota bacterium]